MFPPISLKEDGEAARPIYSARVTLPAEVDAEIRRYVAEDEPTSWTVMIHSALYAYRRQFWTREQLKAELVSAVEEGLRSNKEGKGILVTPAFWKEFEARCDRRRKEIHELQEDGRIGNLLLPEELYAFVKERITSGDGTTPTDVVGTALSYLRAERDANMTQDIETGA